MRHKDIPRKTKAEGMCLHQTCPTRYANGSFSNAKNETFVSKKKPQRHTDLAGQSNHAGSRRGLHALLQMCTRNIPVISMKNKIIRGSKGDGVEAESSRYPITWN